MSAAVSPDSKSDRKNGRETWISFQRSVVFASRSKFSLGLILLGALVANWPYEYTEVFRTASTLQGAHFQEDEWLDSGHSRVIAGWPLKYLVRITYSDAPSFTVLSWVRLCANAIFWASLTFLLAFYERRLIRSTPSEELSNKANRSTKRNLSLIDLLIATTIIAGAIAYWRSLKPDTLGEAPILAEISQRSGKVVKSTWLPRPFAGLLKGLNLPLHDISSVSEVTLIEPNNELLSQVLRFPYLNKLYIGGGAYDLRLLDRLSQKTLLSELRISGRELDSAAVAAIAKAEQITVLNLMRTNVNSKAIESLSRLSRLKVLNVIRTDVDFSDLKSPACAKTIAKLSAPLASQAIQSSIKIHGWNNLEQLICNEYDEVPNDQALLVDLRQLPKLRSILVDGFRCFDLVLEDLPELIEVAPVHSQWTSRLTGDQSVPDSLWLHQLSIAKLPKLRSLDVYAAELTKTHFSEPMTLEMKLNLNRRSASPSKEKLSHSNTPPQWLATLEAETGPDQLKLDGISLHGMDISSLSSNRHLRSLSLVGAGLTNTQINQLAAMENLEELNLSGNKIDGRTIASLVSKLPRLKKMQSDERYVGRLRLEHHSTLQQVFSDRANTFEGDALQLVDIPKLSDCIDLGKKLIHLHIDDAPSLKGISTQSAWPARGMLRGIRDLEYFTAGGNRFDDSLFYEIVRCIRLKQLTLAYSSVSAKALSRIAELQDLESLTLSGSAVDDTVLAQIAKLSKLKVLRLDETNISDTGMQAITQLGRLEQLSLHKTNLSAAGLAHLAALPQLKRLHFGNKVISKEEMQSIVNCRSLHILDLSGAEMKPPAFQPLAVNPPLALDLIGLRSSSIDGGGVTALSIKLANLRFDVANATVDPDAIDALWRAERILMSPAENSSAFMTNSRFECLPWQALNERTAYPGELDPRLFAPPSKDTLNPSKLDTKDETSR